MKSAAAVLLSLLLFVVLAALPSAQPQVPAAREVVAPAAFASADPAARGTTFQLAVVLKIRNGFHINAHEASAEYLIATNLTLEPPAGFQAGKVAYPKGELHSFAFTKTPLNVYEDKVILYVPVSIGLDAATGTQHIPMKLRYQACNNELCLPPVTLDVDAAVNVAANRGAARPAHPELFPAP